MKTQLLPEVRVAPPGPRSREGAARLGALESPSVSARQRQRGLESGVDHSAIMYRSGEGVNVTDVDNNRYVDLTAGFGALLLGHRPERVERALREQQSQLSMALGDVYGSPAKLELCERLVRLFPTPGARVLLGMTGADAVTAALKTAALATGRAGVVAFEGSYHGLSYGPLAACGLRAGFREPFAAQLNPHVTFAPYPEHEADLPGALGRVEASLASGNVGAVLVEPILGRGGCVVPPAGFLPGLADAARRHGALLVADEIWTALGRSGAWLASSRAGVLPDVVCLGKGLGGGLPVSACVGTESAMEAWGAHGGATIHTATHFGVPPGCAAACATLDGLAEGNLPSRAEAVGDRWRRALVSCTRSRGVLSVRGRGLMLGVVLEGGSRRALAVTHGLLKRGWITLTGGAGGEVLTLTPPLCIEEDLLRAFNEALAATLFENPAG